MSPLAPMWTEFSGAIEPDARSTEHDRDGAHGKEVVSATGHHEPAEDEKRNGVRGEVRKPSVEERRAQDAPQAVDVARTDPVEVERALHHELIDGLDGPRDDRPAHEDRDLGFERPCDRGRRAFSGQLAHPDFLPAHPGDEASKPAFQELSAGRGAER